MQHTLIVWLLASSSIQLGTLWIMKTSILPLLNGLPYDRYVNACQLIDMHVFHPIAFWNGIVTAGLALVEASLVDNAAVAALCVVGALAMTGVGLFSEGVNRPIWRQIERWSPYRTADQWNAKRRRWHLAHQARTFSAIGATAAFIGAGVTLLG